MKKIALGYLMFISGTIAITISVLKLANMAFLSALSWFLPVFNVLLTVSITGMRFVVKGLNDRNT